MGNIGLSAVFVVVGYTGVALLLILVATRVFGFGETETDGGDTGGDMHGAVINPFAPMNIAAFFAMFGIVGKEMLDNQYSNFAAVAAGVGSGLASALIIGVVFTALNRLSQSGTHDTRRLIGLTAVVSARIPPRHEGIGLINVTTTSGMRELSAFTNGDAEIPSGRRVKILELEDPTTVVVEAA